MEYGCDYLKLAVLVSLYVSYNTHVPESRSDHSGSALLPGSPTCGSLWAGRMTLLIAGVLSILALWKTHWPRSALRKDSVQNVA